MTRMNTFAAGEDDHGLADEDVPGDQRSRHRRLVQLRESEDDPGRSSRSRKEADGTRRMYQEDIDRVQEFHKCIECFLCQDVCHVIRDHDENKQSFAGPRFFVRLRRSRCIRSTPTIGPSSSKRKRGLGFCNITKCCTEVCPEHIHITDNAIIPLKERIVDRYYDPIAWALRRMRGKATRAGRGRAGAAQLLNQRLAFQIAVGIFMAVLLLVFVIQPAVARGGFGGPGHRRRHLPRDPAHRTVAANSLIHA